MKSVGSGGPGAYRPARQGQQTNPSPSPAQPIGRPRQNSLPDSRGARAIGPRPTFSLPTGTSAHFPTSAELTGDVMTVETLTLGKVWQLIQQIGALQPAEQQIEPLAQMIGRIPDIKQRDHLTARRDPNIERRDRLAALRMVINQTMLIARSVDCSPILAQVPRALKSLDLDEPRDVNERFDGYRVARMPMSLASIRTNSESYGKYLAGVADLLIDLSRVYLIAPRTLDIVPPDAEVDSLFDALDKVPVQHRMEALKSLCRGRLLLPANAGGIITRRALDAAQSEAFTIEQRMGVANALIDGMDVPKDEKRLDGEFARLYLASQDESQYQKVRASLVKELSMRLDHLSPEFKEKMLTAIEYAIDELRGADEPENAAVFVQGPEAMLAGFRLDPPPGHLQTALSRARHLAIIPLLLVNSSKVDRAGPGTNPYFQCYLQLQQILRNETADAAPGVASSKLEQFPRSSGERENALLQAHQAMRNAGNLLRPDERGTADRIIRHASDITRIFDELKTAPVRQRVHTISSLAAARFCWPPATATDVARHTLSAIMDDEFSEEQHLDIAAGFVHGLRLIAPSDERFLSEAEAMHGAFLYQRELSTRMLSNLAEFLSSISLTPAGETIRDAVKKDAVNRQRAD